MQRAIQIRFLFALTVGAKTVFLTLQDLKETKYNFYCISSAVIGWNDSILATVDQLPTQHLLGVSV